MNHKCITEKKKRKKYSYFIDLIKKIQHEEKQHPTLDYVRMIIYDATFLAEILSKRFIDEFIKILKIFFAAQP